MSNRDEPEIMVPISLGQAQRVVQQVLESNDPGASLVRLLLALSGDDRVRLSELSSDPEFRDRKSSQTLLIGLLVLTVFADGEDRRVNGVAEELDMAQSTVIRYLRTWVAIGVLEQDPVTRRYCLAHRWADYAIATDRPPTDQTSEADPL